jgi:hypothetical protein
MLHPVFAALSLILAIIISRLKLPLSSHIKIIPGKPEPDMEKAGCLPKMVLHVK